MIRSRMLRLRTRFRIVFGLIRIGQARQQGALRIDATQHDPHLTRFYSPFPSSATLAFA
jgi:hypothetical protein